MRLQRFRFGVVGGLATCALAVPVGALACGGYADSKLGGMTEIAATQADIAAHAATVAQLIEQEITAALGAPATVSVQNVAATPTAVTMNVSVSMTVDKNDYTWKRFFVVPIGLKQASEGPKSLVAPLSAMVGRMLIEDIGKTLAADRDLGTRIAAAADRIRALSPGDLGG